MAVLLKHKEGKSYNEISDEMEIPRSSVAYIVSKYNKTKQVLNVEGRGRKKITTARQDRAIVMEVKKNRRVSAGSITEKVRELGGSPISVQTVRNRIHESGFAGRVARIKPFIATRNKRRRLAFSKTHQLKDSSYWNRIVFSDESKFMVGGSDGKVMVWRKPHEEFLPQCLKPSFKSGRVSVMVWGCMSASGVGELHFIDGIMNSGVYRTILDTNLTPSVIKMGLTESFVFQHDNDPKHTSRLVTSYLQEKGISVLNWPAQSPDLNPIEHLWEELSRRLGRHHIQNAAQLKIKLKEEWDGISAEWTRNLVSSMPRRMAAVISSRGGPTKY